MSGSEDGGIGSEGTLGFFAASFGLRGELGWSWGGRKSGRSSVCSMLERGRVAGGGAKERRRDVEGEYPSPGGKPVWDLMAEAIWRPGGRIRLGAANDIDGTNEGPLSGGVDGKLSKEISRSEDGGSSRTPSS